MYRQPSAAALNRIIERYPNLSAWGMAPENMRRLIGITLNEHERDRQVLRSQVEAFRICCQFLSLFRRRKTINYSIGTSWSLKHYAQEWAGEYVSNGTLIAASIFLNIPYLHRGDSPNIFLAISSKDFDRVFGSHRAPAGEHPGELSTPIRHEAQRSIE